MLRESPEEQLSSRYDNFYYQLMRRYPTGNLLNTAVDVHEPYLDNDLVDYCLQLPPELRANGKLFQQLLERRFPRLAAIPGARTPPRPGFWQRAWRQLNRRLRQTLFFLRPEPYGDDPGRAILYNHWMRNAARAYVTGLLTSDLLGDTCDMHVVKRLLNDHMTGRRNAYRPLGALVTYAEWLKRFS
jgi:asparagine synthetase B (glutamine-hydrolysing)